jgi:hypothetical protein
MATIDQILHFHPKAITQKDGYRCVANPSRSSLEVLFDEKHPEFDKMTSFPIHLYKDDEQNYYCFSNTILNVVKNSQSYIQSKFNDSFTINLVKTFNKTECLAEKLYHSPFLENIDTCCTQYFQSIYESDVKPTYYNIYVQSYNFIGANEISYSNIADLLLIYYNNYIVAMNSSQQINTLLQDADKRVNYKYACLTYSKHYTNDPNLVIDTGHEYRIKMLYLLGNHYENVIEELKVFFFGGYKSIRNILRVLSFLVEGKDIPISDIQVLNKIIQLIDLFERGFLPREKKFDEKEIERMGKIIKDKTLKPIQRVSSESSDEEKEEKDVKKDVKKDKKGKSRDKKRKEKEEKEEKKEESIDLSTEVKIHHYFRNRSNQVNFLCNHFSKALWYNIIKFPFSFSCNFEMFIDERARSAETIESLPFETYLKKLDEYHNKLKSNTYVTRDIANIYYFYIDSFKKNNLICNLISCDPSILTNQEKIKFYQKSITKDIKNYEREIEIMEKDIKSFISNPLMYSQKYRPINPDFTEIYENCLNDAKPVLENIFNDAEYVKQYDIILFPDIPDEPFYNGFYDKLNNHDEDVQNKIISSIHALGKEIEKYKSDVQKVKKLITTQQEKNKSEADEQKRKKTIDLIAQSLQKIINLENQIKEVNVKLFQGLFKDVVSLFNTKIMKWFCLHSKIKSNNDKINLLEKLSSLLKTYKKTTQDLQNEQINYAVLFVLLQEDLQCCNIEISVLLSQGFIFSPLNQALHIQRQLNDKVFSISYLDEDMEIETLRSSMDNYNNNLFMNIIYKDYKSYIYGNFELQNELNKNISQKMFESRKQEVNDKKQEIEIDYHLTVNELANIHKNKGNLLEYYCKKFNLSLEKDGTIEQIIYQGQLSSYLQEYVVFMFDDLILTKNKEGEFIIGTKSSVEELKYFYNDEFYNYNKELIKTNLQKLKDFFNVMEKSDKIIPDDVSIIKILICCHISSLLINFYYFKNKIFVIENYPAIFIKETNNTIYIKNLVQEVKANYKKLFIENCYSFL